MRALDETRKSKRMYDALADIQKSIRVARHAHLYLDSSDGGAAEAGQRRPGRLERGDGRGGGRGGWGDLKQIVFQENETRKYAWYVFTYVCTYVRRKRVDRLKRKTVARFKTCALYYYYRCICIPFFCRALYLLSFSFFLQKIRSIRGEYTNWDVQREISIIRKEEDIRDEMLGSLCSNKKESSRNGAEG